jgi:hypothetical protein
MPRLLPNRSDVISTRPGAPHRRAAIASGRAAILAALAASTACYQYLPSQPANVRVGEEVRLHLTSNGTAALQPLVGADVEAIDGRVVSRADTAYAVSVGGTMKRAGVTAVWNGEQIDVPVGAVASVDRRVLSKRKTFLMSAASIAGAALVAVVISSVSGGGSGSSDTGTTPP